MAEPYDTFRKIHNVFYEKLKNDKRLTDEYEIDEWDEGLFNIDALPVKGVHARYQRNEVKLEEECTGYYTYRINVNIWILIAGLRSVSDQYDLAEFYLDNITQVMTEKPDDWSLSGIVHRTDFIGASYGHFWGQHGNSILVASASFNIYVDIEHEIA